MQLFSLQSRCYFITCLFDITPNVNHIVLEVLTGNSANNFYNNNDKNLLAKLPGAKRIEITSLWLDQSQKLISQ